MSDGTAEGTDRPTNASGRSLNKRSVLKSLRWGALVAFGVLAVVAGIGLYSSLSSIIDVWIADRFQPIARAAFNFVVLCVAGVGIVLVLRRR